jgi:hypothetical protein
MGAYSRTFIYRALGFVAAVGMTALLRVRTFHPANAEINPITTTAPASHLPLRPDEVSRPITR